MLQSLWRFNCEPIQDFTSERVDLITDRLLNLKRVLANPCRQLRWFLNNEWLVNQVFSIAAISYNFILILTKELFSVLDLCVSQLLKVDLKQVSTTSSQAELPPHY